MSGLYYWKDNFTPQEQSLIIDNLDRIREEYIENYLEQCEMDELYEMAEETLRRRFAAPTMDGIIQQLHENSGALERFIEYARDVDLDQGELFPG